MATASDLSENYRVIFASRPGVNGTPQPSNFRYEKGDVISAELSDNEVLVKTLMLSCDPAQRCQMNEDTGAADYFQALQVDEVVAGLAGVGVVVSSRASNMKQGDLVMNADLTPGWPWQLYWTSHKRHLTVLEHPLIRQNPHLALSYLGIVGLTSLVGLQEMGHLKQGGQQTLVVSGAAGACGHLAGQLGRLMGAGKVIGICGSQEKCTFLVEKCGFDGGINYKMDNVDARLRELCPNGVDCYFDNVGGDLSAQVIGQMNRDSHVVLCGQIAVYNTDVPYPPPIDQAVSDRLAAYNITRERFLVLRYAHKFAEGLVTLGKHLVSGEVHVQTTVSEGLCSAGEAFCGMMSGGNIGKQLVKVADI